jgi:trimeric autotransporter adhesin
VIIKDDDLQAQIDALRLDIQELRAKLTTGVGVPAYQAATNGDALRVVAGYPAWDTLPVPVTTINVTSPITSTGGTTPTIGHATSGVLAGSYTNLNCTIDARGHITAASNGPGGVAWGAITGTLASQTDLNSALNARGVLASSQSWTGVQTFANAVGGSYGAQWVMTNTSGGATNPTKTWRINSVGTMEVINSAFSLILFSFTDAGLFQTVNLSTGSCTITGTLGLPGTTGQYVRGDGSRATFPSIPSGTVTNVASGNGMNFSSFSTSGTVTLGTPSTLTAATSNALTTNSHTHAITGFMPTTGGTFTGAITAPGVTDSSDARFKRDVRAMRDGLDVVLGLMPARFFNLLTEQIEVGLIAQQVREILPEVVSTDDNGDLAVSYQRIVAPLIQAVQAIDQRLKCMEARR